MDFASAILSSVADSMDPMKQANAQIIREHLSTMRVSTQIQKDSLIEKYRAQISKLREQIKAEPSDSKHIASLEDEVTDIYRDIDRVREF